MTNEQIDLLAESFAQEIPALVGELAPHIREAALAVLEETQEKENAKPMLNISFGVSVNLATSPHAFSIKAAVSVKRSVSTDLVLNDPNQPELPMGAPLEVLKKRIKAAGATITINKPSDQ